MTRLMGILNVTPDSFSGDGLAGNIAGVVERIETMMAHGAQIIDIGAESTRPGAIPLSAEAEWERLAPVLSQIKPYAGSVVFSLDTRHADVARKGIDAGCSWINDVSGADAGMRHVARESGATLVLMHSLTVPADPKHVLPQDADPVASVYEWGRKAIADCEAAGIRASQLIFDPGIGFGKTPEQSHALLKQIGRFRGLGVPLLVGHSRKSFLARFAGSGSGSRDAATLGVSAYLIREKVDYLRVHDVRAHMALLSVSGSL